MMMCYLLPGSWGLSSEINSGKAEVEWGHTC